ncbi:MAG: hypothetical protein KGJ30_14750 [Burkholderiales bacterium]|nr:hypothetical protein [Burkholderiales bacterium]
MSDRNPAREQLDLFEHSRDTILRNAVITALERRDAPAARVAMLSLVAEFPRDEALSSLELLVRIIEQPGLEGFADHDALRAVRRLMSESIEPAARRIFGTKDASSWLVPLWRNLAGRSARLAFRAEHSDDHAAVLWLAAGDWPAAIASVNGIESWRRIPAPLSWMLEARHGQNGMASVWPLIAELAWLAPERFERLASKLADPVLDRLLEKFYAAYEGEGTAADLAWFPTWTLTEEPALAPLLGEAQRGLCGDAEQGMRTVVELLGLERQGRQRDIVERRKRLRDLNPSIFAAFMAKR